MQYHYIDGQTPLNEEEKQGLMPSLITRTDLDKWEQENILEARKWIFHSSQPFKYDIFRESFILTVHQRMFNHVWKWAGHLRKSNKNIGVEYYQISLELRRLLEDAKSWLNNNTYSYADLAIIFHHRLVQIHLFSNGNGRHARLIADIIIAKYNNPKLSWGSHSDLNKPDAIRKRYISSLREADGGNYKPILDFARS